MFTVSERQLDAGQVLRESSARHICLFGGARSGKTFLIVREILHRALDAPGSRHLIARFRGNAVWTAIAGDSNATLFVVASTCFGGLELIQHRMDGYFELKNGSTIWLGGLEDKERVDKILGREYSTVYLNEASEIPYGTAAIALTRLAEVKGGIEQRAFIDLNPVGKSHWTHRWFIEHVDPISRLPLRDPQNYVSARLNPRDNAHHLDPAYIAGLQHLSSRHRKRFWEGEYIDEVEGALWTYENIEANRRLPGEIESFSLSRVVIGVDPSGAKSADDMAADEIGIIVAGKSSDGKGYILADRSCRASPREWARAAVNAFYEYGANAIVAETNFGGAMVESTIRSVDSGVPIKLVTASRGKAVRAEPISALYEGNRIHHVGRFPDLEDQFCAFSSEGYKGTGSPDRADAAVWALSELLGVKSTTGIIDYYRGLVEEQRAAMGSPEALGSPWAAKSGPEVIVLLRAPDGITTAYGMSGKCYQIGEDRKIPAIEMDAAPFKSAGFEEVGDAGT